MSSEIEVNDVHSQLNRARVAGVVEAASVADLQRAVASHGVISVCGGRHAMGGQQFASGAVLVDTRRMNRVLRVDQERGLAEVEAGIQWPQLIERLGDGPWGIRQKQTGADRLTIGGALAANAHGRGLKMKPFIDDVESFTLVDAPGALIRASRSENAELFRLAIGGYGLFGVFATVTLRLRQRQKLERVVEVLPAAELMARFEERIAAGFLYGDFQYAIDPESDDFLRRGIFSCYRPVDPASPMPAAQRELSDQAWIELLELCHTDKTQAFLRYSDFYLATSGQIYWSDTHQLSFYPDDYHRALDRKLRAPDRATEMITEIYVPRPELAGFLEEAAEDFRQNRVEVIYGTIRLIERDAESFLAWARQAWACVIFNLHVVHTPQGIDHAAAAFRRLIDMAIRRRGSYFLTYHRWAARAQVEACYPQFGEFLGLKKQHDPQEKFQSEWYRHYQGMCA